MDCRQCGGQCCTFLVLPPFVTLSALQTVGVVPKPEAVPYLALHGGVTFMNGRMRLDPSINVLPYNGRLGRMMLAAAPCAWLKEGRCEHYELRPRECRDFDEHTAERYLVPDRCKFDRQSFGEDVTEIVTLAGEAIAK